jgi:hypothetical protein
MGLACDEDRAMPSDSDIEFTRQAEKCLRRGCTWFTAIYRDGHICDFRFFRKRDRALSGPVGIIYRAVRGDRGCVGFFVD